MAEVSARHCLSLTVLFVSYLYCPLSRFLKVMFSGFAGLLWAGAILCFIATGIEASKGGEDMVTQLMELFPS